jgi:ABC-type hemin transport system ATPase subunit
MRKDHPLAKRPISLQDYCAARHLLVSFSGRAYGFVDEALATIGQQRRIVLTVNQFFTAGRVVVNSDLLTVLPRHFVPTTGMAHELALHELPLAAHYCDRLYLLKDGALAAQGTPAEVLTPEIIADVYGVHALVHTSPRTGKPVIEFLPDAAR